MKKFLEVGEIVTTHALAGEVRVYPWCDTPDFLTEFDFLYTENGEQKLYIDKARVHKNVVVIKFQGYDTVEESAKLRKKILYIDRDDVELDEDAYFIQDLIGLKILDVDTGEEYGKLCDVTQTGANDVYHIKKDGKLTLIPAIPDVIIETNIDEGFIKIRPLIGLFEPEEMRGGEKDAL